MNDSLSLDYWTTSPVLKDGSLEQKQQVYNDFLAKLDSPLNKQEKEGWENCKAGINAPLYMPVRWPRFLLLLLMPFVISGLASFLDSSLYTLFVISCLALPWLGIAVTGFLLRVFVACHFDNMLRLKKELEV